MRLKSTRNNNRKIDALEAVLKGISEDGGLFIPEALPVFSTEEIEDLSGLNYPELAARILGLFFDEIDKDELNQMTADAYRSFDVSDVVPIKKLTDKTYVMELFHGPTLAFKDIALQILPRLMAKALEKSQTESDVLILTATSGDTGKAALEGFRDVPRVEIVVFYPDDGVSDMQKLQMVTQEGENTSVVAVKGNFDDTQNGVKHIFTDNDSIQKILDKGYVLSSANSINIGRLTPQIVYYFWSYLRLRDQNAIQAGEPINVTVPTGNFGNILAAYYAKQMGLPIKKLICASNTNRVLTDFFKDKTYSIKDRRFIKTMSPSMDILISSNLERLVADIIDSDDTVKTLMETLKSDGKYSIESHLKPGISDQFYAGWADEPETLTAIKHAFDAYGYLIDPHTAVGFKVYEDYQQETGDNAPCVLVSTANPYKFAEHVLSALDNSQEPNDAFEAAAWLEDVSQIPIPERIDALKTKPVRHNRVIEKDAMLDAVLDSLD